MRKKCAIKALIVLVFTLILVVGGYWSILPEGYGGTVYALQTEQVSQAGALGSTEAETKIAQMPHEKAQITDLGGAFDVILQGATREFIAGYAIDSAFLIWLNAKYGDSIIIELAYCVLDGEMNPDIWYEKTGNSIHVLWLQFCEDSGFQNYQLENVYWQDTTDTSNIVLGFTGDINFAEDWCTTDYMKAQQNGITDCFSADLLQEMQDVDIMIMNNEFIYMDEDRGTALPGKAYTFRAEPRMAEQLSVFGTDAVVLANNHVYDYGASGLLDTMSCLSQVKIPYVGAGENIEEASKILYFVANGRKIAIVSATQIERTTGYTREATETEPGVLKTLNPERFLQVIAQADKDSDYVIAVVHWGTEGSLVPEASQRILTQQYEQAGADAVIGGHPHRLQGAGFATQIPVAYSLGNFWFSDGTLYTALAQLVISQEGNVQLRYLPCIQKDMVTSLITDPAQKDEFYHYLAAISQGIGIDAMGNVYDKMAEDYPVWKIRYDSDTSDTSVRGAIDNEGYAIDIVGNRK